MLLLLSLLLLLLLLSRTSSLSTLCIRPLSEVFLANAASHSDGYLFSLMSNSFAEQKLLSSMESHSFTLALSSLV